ncbi:hypothetical protein [Acidianus ambivalens]|uniref:hypothetical protein n=1 Tax=Acidianus ambivalens TaxID=2283 RepID=UPI001E5737CC|nr:hypothetical protein [Acidianus ambivalens]
MSEVLRKALEEEVKKKEEENARKLLDLASKEVAKIDTDEVVEELKKWRKGKIKYLFDSSAIFDKIG